MERIIDLELKGLLSRTDRLGYKVEITDEAKRTLAAIGYQRKYASAPCAARCSNASRNLSRD